MKKNTNMIELAKEVKKEEKKMKDTKLYFHRTNWFGYEEEEEQIFLALEEKDISIRIDLAGLVYTTDIDNIEEYGIEDGGAFDTYVELEDAEGMVFAPKDAFGSMEQEYLIDKEIYSDLEEEMKEEYGDITEEKMKEILMENIKTTLRDNQSDPDPYLSYAYWDGEWKEERVYDPYRDTEYTEITEECRGMKEIDSYRGNTYVEELYELQDGSKLLVNYSAFQGELPTAIYVDSKYEKIEEYMKDVAKEPEEHI